MPSTHDSPPDDLDAPLELDVDDWSSQQIYQLLTGLVVPRPIGWISTVSATGIHNVAPHSFFNVASSNPPHVVFSSTGLKDTLNNIRATGEFVVNFVSRAVAAQMNATATDFPAEEDEFAWAGLSARPSRAVAAPRVAESLAQLECRLTQEVPVGGNHLVIGEVLHIHVAAEVWRHGRVDPVLFDPIGRLAGSAYSPLGEIFHLARPTWDEMQGDH